VTELAQDFPKPPVASLAQRLRSAERSAKETHKRLVSALKILVRPGGEMRWTSLRRALRLVGLHPYQVVRHAVVMALLEVVPNAHTARGGEHGRGPRVVKGARLVLDLGRLRKLMAEEWEERLAGDGLPPELQRIAAEYKLGPLSGRHGRLADLVQQVAVRREMASGYFSAACEYLHRNGWSRWPGHKAIWALHCEGATKEEIAAETGTSETKIQGILELHRARAGLVMR